MDGEHMTWKSYDRSLEQSKRTYGLEGSRGV